MAPSEEPALRIDLERIVDARPATLWGVVTDLASYPHWNPFVVACESTLQPGAPIRMRVRVLPWFAQTQTETVFERIDERLLCYGLAGGAVASRRCHELEPLEDGRTRYRSRFRLSGPHAPLVRALLGGRLEHGFAAMTDALVRRAEELEKKSAAMPRVPSQR